MRKGQLTDIPEIAALAKQSIKMMHAEGNNQWDETYPTEESFKEDIRSGTLYVQEEQGEIAGSATIDMVEGKPYKQIKWRSDEKALVLHRLLVNPEVRGKGVASAFMDFLEHLAGEQGISYLKTDTSSLNKPAQKLFERKGFQKVGEMYFEGKEDAFYGYDKFLSH